MIGNFLRHLIFGHQSRRQFMQGLKYEIKHTLKTDPKPVITAICAEAKSIELAHAHLIVDAPSRGHVEFSSRVLAAYRTLLPVIGGQDATTQFVSQAMMKGIDTRQLRFAFWLLLYSCRGKPDRLRDIFSWMMAQYGATFGWTAPDEDTSEKHVFSIEIQKCFYFNFFSANDAAFLTPILCQIDSLWFNMIDRNKHGFVFDKANYQTQGYGAPCCKFPIIDTGRSAASPN